MLFGGITTMLGGISVVNAIRRREELHAVQRHDAQEYGYWQGFGAAWPVAYRRGQEQMLEVCQALAVESAQLMEMNPASLQSFNQLVEQWPQFALQPNDHLPGPTSTSNTF